MIENLNNSFYFTKTLKLMISNFWYCLKGSLRYCLWSTALRILLSLLFWSFGMISYSPQTAWQAEEVLLAPVETSLKHTTFCSKGKYIHHISTKAPMWSRSILELLF